MALVVLGKMGLQITIGIQAPLTAIALKFDIGNLGAVILVLRMEFLKVSLGVELKTEDGWTQVTLIGFNFLGSLATPGASGILKVHDEGLEDSWKTSKINMAEGRPSFFLFSFWLVAWRRHRWSGSLH